MRPSGTELDALLLEYGLGSATVTPLRELGNFVARLEAGSGRFGLRVCMAQAERAQLETELEWLGGLRRDTGLVVPEPLPNRRGETITTLKVGDEERLSVVFRWVEGEPVARRMSLDAARRIGELTAVLHEHARRHRLHTYAGQRYDFAWLAGSESWWATRAGSDLGEETRARLAPAVQSCAAAMERLGEGPEHFGLVHSDLHFGNILEHEGELRVIDFDALGLGHYLLDLGVTEAEFSDYADGPDLVAAYREAYGAVRGTPVFPADVAAFRVAAGVIFLEWVFTSPNPAVREEKLRWVPSVIEGMLEAGRQAGT